MEIKIKIDDKQMKRMKEFGLGGILEDVRKDMEKFHKSGMFGFFNEGKRYGIERNNFLMKGLRKPLMIRKRFVEEDNTLNHKEVQAIENFALKKLHLEVQELFETTKKRELFNLVIKRLSPHSLALLVR